MIPLTEIPGGIYKSVNHPSATYTSVSAFAFLLKMIPNSLIRAAKMMGWVHWEKKKVFSLQRNAVESS